jgi:hypothetical protein
VVRHRPEYVTVSPIGMRMDVAVTADGNGFRRTSGVDPAACAGPPT